MPHDGPHQGPDAVPEGASPSLISHLSLGTNRFEAARAFYDAVLATLGARRVLEIGTLGGYSTIWLARAQRAGLADPSWSPHDVLLLQHMTYGVVLAQGANAPEAVHRALALIDPRLVAP